jgi:hypothetical protein
VPHPRLATLLVLALCGCSASEETDSGQDSELGEDGFDTETGGDESETGSETPCDDPLVADWLGIEAPAPPGGPAKVPSVEWTTVSDTPELLAAVESGAEHIRLEAGIYTADGLPDGHLRIRGQQLWAESFGEVVLRFGIQAGGQNGDGAYAGSELHGLSLDIHELAHAALAGDESAAIAAWGEAEGLVVEDCEIFGNAQITTGIFVSAPEGLRLARVRVISTRRWGIAVYGEIDQTPAQLEDIHVTDIHGPEIGTSGVGLRLATTAEVERVFVRETRFAGIAVLGSSTGTRLSQIDVDHVGLGDHREAGGVGIYFDDTARETVLEHFCVGPNTKIGVNSEWDHYPDPELAWPRGIDNVVRDGVSDAWYAGVHFDQGTVAGEVHHVVFRNYDHAGIVFHANVSSEAKWPDYDDGSSQHDNVFEVPQVDCQTCDLSYSVWSDPFPVCVGGASICPP